MQNSDSFIDLRPRHEGRSATDDSVWPSFTDIMMVIVMIFLMALVLLLLRNTELIDDMRQSDAATQAPGSVAVRSISSALPATISPLSTPAQNETADQGQQTPADPSAANVDVTEDISALLVVRDELTEQLDKEKALNAGLTLKAAELSETITDLTEQRKTLLSDRMALAEVTTQQNLDIDRLTAQLETTDATMQKFFDRESGVIKERDAATEQIEILRDELSALTSSFISIEGNKGQLLTEQTALQTKLSDAKLALTEQQNLTTALRKELDEVQLEITSLQEQRAEEASDAALERQGDTTSQNTEESVQAEIAEKDSQIADLRAQLALQKSNASDSAEVARLEQIIQSNQLELASLAKEVEETQSSRQELIDDLKALKVRYNRLVKPARSSVGRYVVEISYRKRDGEEVITLREPDQQPTQPMTRSALMERLDALKALDPDKLYTRIRFPDSDGLNHKEAFEFEWSILTSYDYYYKEEDTQPQ